ncbi:MAG: AmmeMemoRadiSam system radical SAM enzyme [Eubacteriales bacterium]|nr:AmmeMemoRadiSam system radical SAM enzyme [Eubacteriales bacterium]
MKCELCPHHCNLDEGEIGFCKGRTNKNGRIVPNNYGRVTSLALDPIEKKPLARFHPGSQILSVGSYGCNLRCPFCQNHDISMADSTVDAAYFAPEFLVRTALSAVDDGNIGLAFTYNEPLISYEYIRDCARLAKKNDLSIVLVTNGMICEEPLLSLLPYIDAMNIDLKGTTQAFYDIVKGDLETVKTTIAIAAFRCHVEITSLIIPGLNDTEEEMAALSGWLASIDPAIPLHVTRFFPRHQMKDRPPTPIETVERLRDVAAEKLRYVYTGNC